MTLRKPLYCTLALLSVRIFAFCPAPILITGSCSGVQCISPCQDASHASLLTILHQRRPCIAVLCSTCTCFQPALQMQARTAHRCIQPDAHCRHILNPSRVPASRRLCRRAVSSESCLELGEPMHAMSATPLLLVERIGPRTQATQHKLSHPSLVRLPILVSQTACLACTVPSDRAPSSAWSSFGQACLSLHRLPSLDSRRSR